MNFKSFFQPKCKVQDQTKIQSLFEEEDMEESINFQSLVNKASTYWMNDNADVNQAQKYSMGLGQNFISNSSMFTTQSTTISQNQDSQYLGNPSLNSLQEEFKVEDKPMAQLKIEKASSNKKKKANIQSAASQSAKRVKFTKLEDQIIVNSIKQIGKKWNEIASNLPGKSPVMVRNRYYSSLRKQKDENNSVQMQAEGLDLTLRSQQESSAVSECLQMEEFDLFSNGASNKSQILFEDFDKQNNHTLNLNQKQFVECSNNNNNFYGLNNNGQNYYQFDQEMPPNPNMGNMQDNMEQDVLKLYLEDPKDLAFKNQELFIDPPIFQEDLDKKTEHDNNNNNLFLAQSHQQFGQEQLDAYQNGACIYECQQQQVQKQQVQCERINKIQELHGQISVIENMLEECKNQIIKELMDRTKVSRYSGNTQQDQQQQAFNHQQQL